MGARVGLKHSVWMLGSRVQDLQEPLTVCPREPTAVLGMGIAQEEASVQAVTGNGRP